MSALMLAAMFWLAYANGANDNSKGVATLAGSGLATYRKALMWGTLWTVAGGLAALAVSAGLVATFSTALVSTSVAASPAFPLAVTAGACAWVLLASWCRLPVSTTHSLTGAIVGASLVAGGSASVRWPLLLATVGLPLAFSPFASAGLAYALHAIAARPLSRASRYCICVADQPLVLSPALQPPAAGMPSVAVSTVTVGAEERCEVVGYQQKARLTDTAHWATSATLSFARGLNDNPKIVALGALALAPVGLAGAELFLLSAAAMGLGGYVFGRRVTHTLAERVTPLDPVHGLVSSTVASSLVLLASGLALPVSTTHVASGAILGAGLRRAPREVEWAMVATMASAWLVTLPLSAAFAAAVSWLLAR